MTERDGQLELGADVIQLLLPHRRPFLMVDRVLAYRPGPPPSLRASRSISANEPVFDGHFPGHALWPGVYTIEGLGQACALLARLEGQDLAALRNLALGYRLHPGYRAVAPDRSVVAPAAAGLAVAAAVNVKLLHPVFAGDRLDYAVTLGRTLGDSAQFEVEASVDGRAVARGTLTSAILPAPPGVA